MISLKVKSLWQGQIGIPQKYVKVALTTAQGMRFNYGAEAMELKMNEVRNAVVGVSQEKFKDRFNGTEYRLVYFKWLPNQPTQRKLL